MFHFEELDDETRKYMRAELEYDITHNNFYRSKRLTDLGRIRYPDLLKLAIQHGNDASLIRDLSRQEYWVEREEYVRDGVTRTRNVNFENAVKVDSENEFNGFYMRGLCARLIEEGEEFVEVYRAKEVDDPRQAEHQYRVGMKVNCKETLMLLRARVDGKSPIDLQQPGSGRSLRRSH